jgi:hypothetical protein
VWNLKERNEEMNRGSRKKEKKRGGRGERKGKVRNVKLNYWERL